MWCGIISLFPEMVTALNVGITGRAVKDGILALKTWNPRDFATDKHKSVDDRPYGGGPGMVMMAEPLQAAIHAAKQAAPVEKPTVIYLSPQGRLFDQEAAVELAAKPAVIFIAGRYEGIDERIIEQEVDEEWSIGDYILTGGELAAMVMVDAATRLLPGAVGDEDSVTQDSLTSGCLKYPQYTRPETFEGLTVPPVLLSGNHQQIEAWRLKQSLGKTWLRRPDLLAKMHLKGPETELLTEFIEEFLRKAK
ncbi:MAG: tRNA (guanosine(37)-N1)-methyltransferase TrmD [Gammaproteobacteria bacterium]|nr:MAG: tRNA (guanosine(37)-N1)-methyltransferase TrmD [Gammaproteobacteria bacterium]